jgi:hypothetical protein
MRFASGSLGHVTAGIAPVLQSPTTRSRKSSYAVRDMLREAGHTVIHNNSVLPPADLVAWKPGGDPLIVQVRRSRRPLENAQAVVRRFRTDLGQLGSMSKPRNARLQVWLFHTTQGWKTYDVFPGGIMEDTSGHWVD